MKTSTHHVSRFMHYASRFTFHASRITFHAFITMYATPHWDPFLKQS
ncbi:hypothetical protein QUF80_19950 [Desulfococcaceae bacterium HSG8]|nr:hypothetical protein [Desulfococcaceae bacterium HSG8]